MRCLLEITNPLPRPTLYVGTPIETHASHLLPFKKFTGSEDPICSVIAMYLEPMYLNPDAYNDVFGQGEAYHGIGFTKRSSKNCNRAGGAVVDYSWLNALPIGVEVSPMELD
ncbi:hypothetical protein VNO77_43656 [Canavalia gladiata]|uniref:Uncharacterized protein n=1 Tax=Canavalia gladiata TaxID=3824 RepID=A0AAN9JX50_CANGL